MKVKSFYGDTVLDALNKVKAEMGSDAVIVQRRKRRRGGLLGLFRPPLVEVVAAVDQEHQQSAPDRKQELRLNELFLNRNNAVSSQIAELKQMIAAQVTQSAPNLVYPHLFEQFFQILLDSEVKENLAREIIDKALHQVDQSLWKDQESIKNKLLEIIAGYFSNFTGDPTGEKELIALIGSTGVGKTTTIAKLAAISSVLKDKKVALITIDTFRIAAVDQLKTYADIISVPLEVAHTPKELRGLLAKLIDKDLVLIDTAGRSPFNKLQITEIRGFLEALPDLKIYLVLSIATNQKDLAETIARFGQLHIDKLVLTKLDETHSYGTILNIVNECQKGLAYLTAGQSVPDDIEIPIPEKIAKLILQERDQIERSSRKFEVNG